jgi:deoxycytidylate deaminase
VYYKARKKALNNGRVYHLAAILKRGKRVVRVGENTDKTHPRFKRTYPDGQQGSHMHAEMNVLRFARPGDTLEVIRFLKTGGRTMAKPCIYCMKHIKEAGIKRVRYTNFEGEWECIQIT